MIELKHTNAVVKIDQGELVSYNFGNEELIHQKGNPGWGSSDTEMFPVIGSTAGAGFQVQTPKGICYQDQHGLFRESSYQLKEQDVYRAVFEKTYTADTKIANSKFPDKSPIEFLSWPYDFRFTKTFELFKDRLIISFELVSAVGMPFMLGYHPAFMLSGDLSEICTSPSADFGIQQIIDGGARALPVLNTDRMNLIKKEGHSIEITTKGFDNFMLWTEVPNMLCIEPITAYPYAEGKLLAEELFSKSTGKEHFEVCIRIA